jgi:hypothetical protein
LAFSLEPLVHAYPSVDDDCKLTAWVVVVMR